MSSPKQFVEQAVAENKVVIFSKTYCPYCVKAKAAMQKFIKPEQFTVIELEDRDDCDEVQNALAEVTGGRSVPRVFVNGVFIGGGDDTARKAGNGELEALLVQAGVLAKL